MYPEVFMKRLMMVLFLLVWVACTPQAVRRYYAVNYVPTTTRERPPIEMKIWLQEVSIDSTYNRSQIVYRYSPYELQYFANRLWADRPQRMIQQLILRDLISTNTFEAVYDRLAAEAPTHSLITSVEALEEQVGAGVNYAHLSMTFRLMTYQENREIWRYHFDDRRPVNGVDTELTVRAISELLQTHLELMRADLYVKFPPTRVIPDREGESDPLVTSNVSTGTPAVVTPKVSEWTKTWQYNADTTVIPAGQGAIFVPALSNDGSREPPIEVVPAHDQSEGSAITGQTGRRLPLDPGSYLVYLGSGTLGQRMKKKVTVVEGQVTVVEPFWSALEVEVLDKRFIPVREIYDLYRMEDREYYGLGSGADEELGEQTSIWILPTGLYKIVQTGGSYRSRTNFATVAILEGEFTRFGLVIDPATGDFLGAGVIEEEPDEEVKGIPEAWRASVALGGDVKFENSSEGTTEQTGTSLAVNLFADNLFRYRKDPHLWTTRLELEEGQSRYPEGGLRNSADRLYLHSIYLYEVTPWLGPYVRAGGETPLLPRTVYFTTPTEVIIRDPDGTVVETLPEQVSLPVRPGLAPMELKEGVGGNFQVIQTLPLELDLRLGLGGRQYRTWDEQVLISVSESPAGNNDPTPTAEYQQTSSYSLGGLEFTLVGTARLTRYLQARTELDGLLPRQGVSNTLLTWRTTASLRLSSFASLNYTLDMARDPLLNPDQPLTMVNSLQLRFFYAPL